MLPRGDDGLEAWIVLDPRERDQTRLSGEVVRWLSEATGWAPGQIRTSCVSHIPRTRSRQPVRRLLRHGGRTGLSTPAVPEVAAPMA